MSKGNILYRIVQKYSNTSLILRILIGMTAGAILGLLVPSASFLSIPGTLFVSALKAIAPILVFVLVISSLANGQTKFDQRFGFVIFEYLFSTFAAAMVAVAFSFLFPVSMALKDAAQVDAVPSGIGEVLENLLVGMFTNPVSAIAGGNYISILFWAVVFGILMKKLAGDGTRMFFNDLSEIFSRTVKGIINLAPFGILGLCIRAYPRPGCPSSGTMAC